MGRANLGGQPGGGFPLILGPPVFLSANEEAELDDLRATPALLFSFWSKF